MQLADMLTKVDDQFELLLSLYRTHESAKSLLRRLTYYLTLLFDSEEKVEKLLLSDRDEAKSVRIKLRTSPFILLSLKSSFQHLNGSRPFCLQLFFILMFLKATYMLHLNLRSYKKLAFSKEVTQ